MSCGVIGKSYAQLFEIVVLMRIKATGRPGLAIPCTAPIRANLARL